MFFKSRDKHHAMRWIGIIAYPLMFIKGYLFAKGMTSSRLSRKIKGGKNYVRKRIR